jgi:hypothetical protein
MKLDEANMDEHSCDRSLCVLCIFATTDLDVNLLGWGYLCCWCPNSFGLYSLSPLCRMFRGSELVLMCVRTQKVMHLPLSLELYFLWENIAFALPTWVLGCILNWFCCSNRQMLRRLSQLPRIRRIRQSRHYGLTKWLIVSVEFASRG